MRQKQIERANTPKNRTSQLNAPVGIFSVETTKTIASKLKQKADSSRKNVKEKRLKEFNEGSQSARTGFMDAINRAGYGTPKNNDQSKGGGFIEKEERENEAQRNAIKTIAAIKKGLIRKRTNLDLKNKRESLAQTTQSLIPSLNFHLASMNGIKIPTGLGNLAVDEAKKQNIRKDEIQKHWKVDNPDSILHVANLHQNKEFGTMANVETEGNQQFLKINAPDAYTFYRLNHEIEEMNRKKQNFQTMKQKNFDEKKQQELIDYDSDMDKFDLVEKEKMKIENWKKNNKKDYEYAKKVANRLKESGNVQGLSLEKNLEMFIGIRQREEMRDQMQAFSPGTK